ncbi:hypothetical protein FACS1894162_0630 [Bacteroidia bacterium]|nr:hypothetical protein FACS1894162_0630 [Bacteroidia bacterium]
MNRTVFFSWQSDLPNNTNRNYIEKCLQKTIQYLQKDMEYNLELNIDRATKNEIGTIDITESIFKKINHACFFVADISTINGKSRKYKKTPNPNVLLELGYAAKTMGWDKIICIFNSKYGSIKDLPFDIRNRRILTYKDDDDTKILISQISEILKENYQSTLFSNEILDYYNSDIYLSLLRIVMDFSKFIFGYEHTDKTTFQISKMLSIEKQKLDEILTQSLFLGFNLFKSYKVCIDEIKNQLEKIIPIKHFNDYYYVPLVRLIDTLRIYDKELNRRGDLDKLEEIKGKENCYTILENKDSFPTRKALLKKIDSEKAVVIDYGDFIRKDHILNLQTTYKLKPISIKFYSGFIMSVIKHINDWIDNNGGEFVLDETRLENINKK